MRAPDSDVGVARAAQARARRVAPTASEFTKRVVMRDTRGNEYAEPKNGDRNKMRLLEKYGSGVEVFYIRPRSRIPDARNRIAVGSSLRLLDLPTRHELSATVLEVVHQTERRGARGYVVVSKMRDTGQALELSIFK